MILRTLTLISLLTFVPVTLHHVGSFEGPSRDTLEIMPLQVPVPNPSAEIREIQIVTRAPNGDWHEVTDMQGNGSWFVQNEQVSEIELAPAPQSYAGPLEVWINGHLADYGSNIWSDIFLEKVLVSRMSDGMTLKVHYTDFALQQTSDIYLPHKVMQLLKKTYTMLTREMGFSFRSREHDRSIEIYLGQDDPSGLLPFGGFTSKDFKRAPLFIIKQEEQLKKTRVILMPVDYARFRKFWSQINHVPYRSQSNLELDLAGSIMHEMTHAVLHAYHENLGSTEHRIRSGDWYTEGLARYFETKVGSLSAFSSQGFRRFLDDRIQFSRGGANYYLRYPDENLLSMRYEASLFWLYFEERFGMGRILALTRQLRGTPFDSPPSVHLRLLEKVIRQRSDRLFDDFFNWLYLGGYRDYAAARYLLPVAISRSVWSKGEFLMYSQRGDEVYRAPTLDADWVSEWGEAAAKDMTETIAGDWDTTASVQPMGFDVHEILIGKSKPPTKLRIKNTGPSRRIFATIYLHHEGEVLVLKKRFEKTLRVHLDREVTGDIVKIGIVLSNLDTQDVCRYSIELE